MGTCPGPGARRIHVCSCPAPERFNVRALVPYRPLAGLGGGDLPRLRILRERCRVGRPEDGLGQKATGTIFAAFSTALPEGVVTLVAVAFGTTAASRELGVRAALGGPLALSTIAYATVGITLILCGRHLPQTQALRDEFRQLARDKRWFLIVFAAKVTLGVLVFAWKHGSAWRSSRLMRSTSGRR